MRGHVEKYSFEIIKGKKEHTEMRIHIPRVGMIKKQQFDIVKDVSIICGYNNSGKTTILKVLDDVFHNMLMERFIRGKPGEIAIYIPTNRVIVSENNTEEYQLKDYEEFIHYQKDSYRDYSLHLKRLRDQLMACNAIHAFIFQTIRKIFGINLKDANGRYSDGIENIINIYLNIIWAMTWDIDISSLTPKMFTRLLSQKQVIVMIDEVEMFLHVNVQSKLISSLKENFSASSFILTTHSPLLLTRYQDCQIYEIVKGKLEEIECDVYYEDLNTIYEQFFEVDELPEQFREAINYLGDLALTGSGSDIDRKEINVVIKRLRTEYPNLCIKYNAIITKAQNSGDPNDKN